MKISVALAVLILSILGVSLGLPEIPKRLIKFNETHKGEWLTEEQILSLLEKRGARNGPGFMDITDFPNMENYTEPSLSTPPPATCQRFTARVNRLVTSLSTPDWRRTLTSLSNDYFTRYYTSATGESAAIWIQEQFQRIATQYGRTDIRVQRFVHSAWRQPSVIATIPGSQTDERVIIGGHLDSVGSTSTGRSPGADDDGSGIMSVLEIYRNLLANNFRPRFTTEFMGYAAEEGGLRGSAAIANSYNTNRVQVRGALQLDMTGYRASSNVATVITDNTNPALTAFLRLCTRQYAATGVTWEDDRCGYACSDHASWTRASFASAFVFETRFSQSNPNIHSASDTMTYITDSHALHFLKVGTAFVVEMAEDATA